MTLQQLEYVLALAEYGHFVQAAEACKITQSTLSSMIKKLEEELDIVIFDRNSHPVRPTLAGEAVVAQARVVVYHARQLKEMTLSERQKASGTVKIGVTPTIAPYIIPKLFRYIDTIPEVDIQASEMDRDKVVRRLKNAELDMGIMSLPHPVEGLLEIPVYREEFWAYVSPNDPLYGEEELCYDTLPRERLWSLRHEICYRLQVAEAANEESLRSSFYEAGNVATLLHIVNENSGFTIIPELHIPMLRPEHRAHLRRLVGPTPTRQVSLYVRQDYVREALLNIVAEGLKQIIPPQMIDDHLAHYPIRL